MRPSFSKNTQTGLLFSLSGRQTTSLCPVTGSSPLAWSRTVMVGLTCRLLGEGVLQMSSFFFAISSGQSGESLLMGNAKLCWHSPQRHSGSAKADNPAAYCSESSQATLPRDTRTCGTSVPHQVCKSTSKPKIGGPSPRAPAPLLHNVFGQTEILNKSNRL